MECYCGSKRKIDGYRQRKHAIWRYKEMFNITEQRLMDQDLSRELRKI